MATLYTSLGHMYIALMHEYKEFKIPHVHVPDHMATLYTSLGHMFIAIMHESKEFKIPHVHVPYGNFIYQLGPHVYSNNA